LAVLSDGRRLKFMFLPEGEDPDSLVRRCGGAVFLEHAARAVPAIEYLFDQLADHLDMGKLDDQAKLASLVMPYIEQVPEGILRELMLNRLQTVTGFRPGARQTARTPTRRPDRTGPRLPALAGRLVSCLFRKPSLVTALDEELIGRLRDLAPGDPFVDMVKYLEQNPEADLPELLGRWIGHELHDDLLRLADRRPDIDDDALVADFVDGVRRYLEQRGRANRRELLAELKRDPSEEKLRRFWSLKQGGNSGTE
jgi:DNA primase